MNTKHTPGPWLIQCGGFRGWQVHKEDDFLKPLATVYARNEDYGNDGGPYYDEESRANARLVAASPELLATLVVLVDHASEKYPHFESERGQRDIKRAQAAIAKVEGATP